LLTIAALVMVACTAPLPTPAAQPQEPIVAADPPNAGLLPASAPPFSTSEWATDFTRRTIAWEDVISGGPPKDGIPAIDDPTFEPVAAATQWLSERDPGYCVCASRRCARLSAGDPDLARDRQRQSVSGKPVAVTFCPLCNASIVFDRTFGGEVLDFGTTGKLRDSDLIMYDRQTETWWQQFTGEGIVGQARR
jgi:hypothetical protein